ncbi:MAG: hypothetical protein VW274_05385 [Thalassolituus sp.]
MTPEMMRKLLSTTLLMSGTLRNPTVYGRPVKVSFAPTFYTAEDIHGNPIKVMSMRIDPNNKGFDAYICPYIKGHALSVVLGPDADYCLTTTMNGCTFSVGSQTSDGTCIVTHGNKLETGFGDTYQDKVSSSLHWGDQIVGYEPQFLAPGDYQDTTQPGRTNLTTVGIKNSRGQWEFFYQRYKTNWGGGGGKLLFLGTSPFTSAQVRGGYSVG